MDATGATGDSGSASRAARTRDETGGDLPALPEGFRFGTSTAAYQIEGAAAEDGKGPSIWDTFSHRHGTIADGSTGDVACDHYHRYGEDVELMQRLGAGGYRFSVSWPRVQPLGWGAVNEAGLDFYDRLVDELLIAGVKPMVTLYHWDLPQALEDRGGWLDRDLADRFAEYAEIVARRLGDRVEHWIPINEPNVVTMLGYALGTHAPGRQMMFEALPVAHHVLLAHGKAAIALRAAGAQSVGCANNHAPMWPASEDPADVGATKLFDALWNDMFVEPMLLGRYPSDLEPLLEDVVEPGDLATIRQPLDFYGVNYYNPMKIAAAPEDAEMPFEYREVVGYPTTDFGWPVVPDALREWLITLRARYRAGLEQAITAFEQGGRADLVAKEAAELLVLEAYLPQRLSAAEVAAEVGAIVAELGASGPGDMGKVMAAAKAKLGGRAEMGLVSGAVRQALAK